MAITDREEEIISELANSIEELGQQSKYWENFSFILLEPLKGESFRKWRIYADRKSDKTTTMASVKYYPQKNIFEGYCNGPYKARSLEEVKKRLWEKFP